MLRVIWMQPTHPICRFRLQVSFGSRRDRSRPAGLWMYGPTCERRPHARDGQWLQGELGSPVRRLVPCPFAPYDRCMPQDTALTFGDLIGQFDELVMACPNCGRVSRHSVGRQALRHGRNAKIADRTTTATRDCVCGTPEHTK